VLFIGSFMYSIIFGRASVLMASLNVHQAQFAAKMDTVSDERFFAYSIDAQFCCADRYELGERAAAGDECADAHAGNACS